MTALYANEKDPDLGYKLRHGATFRAIKGYSPKDVCYDVSYRIDELSRRTVGRPFSPDHPTVILFGCSFTFGEGLGDEATLQARLSEATNVFNYATPGYGPQHMLAKIQQGNLPQEVEVAHAVGVYLLPPFHITRAAAHSNQAWLFGSPYFYLDEDRRPRRAGSFRTGRRLTTAIYRHYARIKARSALLQVLGFDLPPSTVDEEVELTAAIVRESARTFEAQMHGPLVVVLHPWWSREGSRSHLAMLRQDLSGAPGLMLLDYSDWPVEASDLIRPGCDNHPSGALAARLSSRLLEALRPQL